MEILTTMRHRVTLTVVVLYQNKLQNILTAVREEWTKMYQCLKEAIVKTTNEVLTGKRT